MMRELLQKLKETPGTKENSTLYSEGISEGVISLKIDYHYRIYLYYQERLNANKKYSNKEKVSRLNSCVKFNCHEMTIRRAIKLMEV